MSNASNYTKKEVPAARGAASHSSGKSINTLPAVLVTPKESEPAQAMQDSNEADEYCTTISSSDIISPDIPGGSQNNGSAIQRFKAPIVAGKNSSTHTQFKPPTSKPNRTGLPDDLKSGIEEQSGFSMDDVKVHYNSDKPVQLQAHAFAQGSDIHLGPGQEKHLPHEAWHVVQQKQGRVKPTIQMKGQVNVNDDEGLEKEADEMGAKALQSQVQRSYDMPRGWEPGASNGNVKPVKQLLTTNSSSGDSSPVAQLTRLSTVDKAGYDAKFAEIIEELGARIGEDSGAGRVYRATLTKAALKRYQEDEAGDVPVEDEEVAIKIVSSNIIMNADGDVPREVQARDEIEAKNKENDEAGELPAPSITPDTYEVITVTDPDKESEVVKYVIIMRLEQEGSLASKKITRISDYTPEFDAEMKTYANQLKAALTVVKEAGYHPGDMKADNTLITDVDGDPKRAILADFGSYTKAEYTTMMDDITFVMNSIFHNKDKLPKKDKAAVITWMANDQLWKPPAVARAQGGAGGEGAAAE